MRRFGTFVMASAICLGNAVFGEAQAAGNMGPLATKDATLQIYPFTARMYRTSSGPQFDAIFDYTERGKTAKRVRFGVTGCVGDSPRSGSFGIVNEEGSPKGGVDTWVETGDKVMDEAAIQICAAWEEKAKAKLNATPPAPKLNRSMT